MRIVVCFLEDSNLYLWKQQNVLMSKLMEAYKQNNYNTYQFHPHVYIREEFAVICDNRFDILSIINLLIKMLKNNKHSSFSVILHEWCNPNIFTMKLVDNLYIIDTTEEYIQYLSNLNDLT